MNNFLPIGIYLENDKRFEFDFARYLLKIKTYNANQLSGTIVSPFRLIKNNEDLYLLIHNYDRTGDRKIKIESIGMNELVINHENISYKLNKVA
ncbi:hypothetical protein [Mucilaginibacter boryungensis]|uniref:Uncharacterized protein n=1 Tax=Mucilaginibacter boryungensis TaxID=768480 RepID=A0ABR9XH87_9SPHI|nr:hypothetical protein [Mucilaginibacter boryungensis]MBE9666547.1 hypothetical protein [Mucilaginibacter boryungensis]